MKIVTVCSSYRVFGAETITLKMLEGLKRNGHEMVAVTSLWTDGEFSRRLEAMGIPDVKLALGALTKRVSPRYLWWTANTLLQLPGAWRQWRRLLGEFKPDVILFTSSRQALLLYPWLRVCPCFLIEHAQVNPGAANVWLYKRLSGRMARFIAVSDSMRRFYAEMGLSHQQVSVVKNGPFDEDYFQKSLPSRNDNESGATVRIGIVGQISPRKGHESLVRATRLLADHGVHVEVNVFGAGDSDFQSHLKQMLAERNVEQQWHWMGYHADQHAIYRKMDICVMPSSAPESFGMVAAEASAHGLPVVASKIGGLPEIVENGVTGILVEPGNAEQLATAIESLARDPVRAHLMGTAGRERVFKNFSVKKMVAELEAVFQSPTRGAS